MKVCEIVNIKTLALYSKSALTRCELVEVNEVHGTSCYSNKKWDTIYLEGYFED